MDIPVTKRTRRLIGLLLWALAATGFAVGLYRARQADKVALQERTTELEELKELQAEARKRLSLLEARDQAMAALQQSVSYGYAVLDSMGKVKEWNPAMQVMTGRNFEEMQGRDLLSIMSPETGEKHVAAYQQAMQRPTGMDVQVVSCRIHPKTGPPFAAQVTVRIVRVNGGEPYAIAMVERATQVKEIEAED